MGIERPARTVSQNFQNATFNKKHNQQIHEVLHPHPQVYHQT